MCTHRLAPVIAALLLPAGAAAAPVCNPDRLARGIEAMEADPENAGRITATLLAEEGRRGTTCPGLPKGLREGLEDAPKSFAPGEVDGVVAATLDEPDVAPLVAARCKDTEASSLGQELASDYERCGIGKLRFATKQEFVSASAHGGNKRLTLLSAVVYERLLAGEIRPEQARRIARSLGGIAEARARTTKGDADKR